MSCRIWVAWVVLGCALGGGSRLSAAPAPDPGPRYFSAPPGALARSKARVAAGDAALSGAVQRLAKEADKLLKQAPPSVVEKERMPPDGDRHSYMSQAPYFWAKSEDGAETYERRDGQRNPESQDLRFNDAPRMSRFGKSVETLALAYYFTGNEAYAAQAAANARTWFLDPATRMNPHLKYGQAVPGVNEGRAAGVLEGVGISVAADALGLLAGSKAWPESDQKAVDAWLATFLEWLQVSDLGQKEHGATNNHGTWYDVQTARLLLCLGRRDAAARVVEEAKRLRVAAQIEPDGRQPRELARTTSFNYSCYNLEAMCDLATLGEHAGVDLWQFRTADGRSLRGAIEFMVPYVSDPPKPWTWEQIKDKQETGLMRVLHRAAAVYGVPAWAELVRRRETSGTQRFWLLSGG